MDQITIDSLRMPARTGIRLVELEAHLDHHALDLADIAGIVAGEIGEEAVDGLVAAIADPRAELQAVRVPLDRLVAMLEAAPAGLAETEAATGLAQPDVNAALRWHGARLQEFSRRLAG